MPYDKKCDRLLKIIYHYEKVVLNGENNDTWHMIYQTHDSIG